MVLDVHVVINLIYVCFLATDTLPGPPTQVTVSSVEYNSAVIKFQPSASPDLSHYLVGVQEGSEQSLFIYNVSLL